MKRPIIQFGIETEYGIWREAEGEPDVVADSIALVRCAAEPGVWMRWDYAEEDPHADARGFRVGALRQDVDEADYVEQDSRRRLSFVEIKSDLVLANGARFYNDHAHPEYCTPECSDPGELVLQDRAGEMLVMACARSMGERLGQEVRLYKNNTDYCGHSYGCHENYLLPRSLAWEDLAAGVESFLVTRQIFTGAGKCGIEAEDEFLGPGLQLAQRSDFFSELQGVDTMQNRPLINTRDEPHADPERYRRFHVIVGDANLCPFATRLKVGVTALVLEARVLDPRRPLTRLRDPLAALRSISRDTQWRWEVETVDGRRVTAVDVQREYWVWVKEVCEVGTGWRAEVMQDWGAVLDDLAADPMRCQGRLDWVTKLGLWQEFQEAEGVEPQHALLRGLDLEYHRMDREAGLYYGLEAAGAIREVPAATAVMRALAHPPATTRAAVRGRCISKFGAQVLSAHWSQVTLSAKRGPVRVSLLDLFEPEDIVRATAMIEAAASTDELRAV